MKQIRHRVKRGVSGLAPWCLFPCLWMMMNMKDPGRHTLEPLVYLLCPPTGAIPPCCIFCFLAIRRCRLTMTVKLNKSLMSPTVWGSNYSELSTSAGSAVRSHGNVYLSVVVWGKPISSLEGQGAAVWAKELFQLSALPLHVLRSPKWGWWCFHFTSSCPFPAWDQWKKPDL